MSAEPENLSLAASLLAAVVPRLRVIPREGTVAPAELLHLGATVVLLADAQGTVLQITPNARFVLGEACERAAEFALSLIALLQPEDPEDVDRLIRRFAETPIEDSFTTDLLTRAPSGSARWLELWCRCVQSQSTPRYLVEVRDVTLRRGDEGLRSMLSAALQHLPESVLVTDLAGIIRYVNPAFERQTGYAAPEVLGRTPALLKSGQHRPEEFEKLWRAVTRGDTWQGELCNRRRSGELYHEHVLITPVRDAQGVINFLVSAARDITQKKAADAQREERAYYDELTALPTVRLLRERSTQMLALARRHHHRAALLQVDIEGIRSINHSLGRPLGDELLRMVAERLQQSLRDSDTIARVEGRCEFLILLGEVEDDDAIARVARRLRDAVRLPFRIQDHALTVNAAVGIGLYPQDAAGFDEVSQRASLALQRAQLGGTGIEFYQHGLNDLTADRLALEEDLRWAWERKQFLLHYQPVVALAALFDPQSDGLSGRPLSGLEALARWPHMERGLIEPDRFIPLAERTGRIGALDRWSIATAVQQAVQWSSMGWEGWVSVNLSAQSLLDSDLPAFVTECLEGRKLEAGRLVLEVPHRVGTERELSSAARILEQLKQAGASIALTEFGAGQSSLAHLLHLPADIVKMPRSALRDLGYDERADRLVDLVIGLARQTGLRVVAEGVEHLDQLDWLRRAGCDYAQGFLVGRPRPADEIRPLDPPVHPER